MYNEVPQPSLPVKSIRRLHASDYYASKYPQSITGIASGVISEVTSEAVNEVISEARSNEQVKHEAMQEINEEVKQPYGHLQYSVTRAIPDGASGRCKSK